MKRVYFYDKKSSEYVGMTNSGQVCPVDCLASELEPNDYDGAEGLDNLEVMDMEQPATEKKESKAGDYADLVATYTDRQIQGAMIRAKGFKLKILTAEKAKREQ